jgi:protein-S-isoprenylcysteine O-methyltransferase Ste14
MSLKERLVTHLTTGVASVVIYLPIIAGIITPMVYLLPAWYLSWYAAGMIFPFYEIWHGFWMPVEDFISAYIIWGIEIIVFVIGIGLSGYALREMVIRRKEDVGLVISGPYSWVRHPQHLGILLFLLPFAITFKFRSGFTTGIRPGDILSWTLMAFLLLMVADCEESRLLKEFGEQYTQYCENTPFIIPLKIPINIALPSWLEKGKPVRYIITFLIFWAMISLVLYRFSTVDLAFTR